MFFSYLTTKIQHVTTTARNIPHLRENIHNTEKMNSLVESLTTSRTERPGLVHQRKKSGETVDTRTKHNIFGAEKLQIYITLRLTGPDLISDYAGKDRCGCTTVVSRVIEDCRWRHVRIKLKGET